MRHLVQIGTQRQSESTQCCGRSGNAPCETSTTPLTMLQWRGTKRPRCGSPREAAPVSARESTAYGDPQVWLLGAQHQQTLDLPDELLIHVSDFLSVDDLAQCMQTCLDWHRTLAPVIASRFALYMFNLSAKASKCMFRDIHSIGASHELPTQSESPVEDDETVNLEQEGRSVHLSIVKFGHEHHWTRTMDLRDVTSKSWTRGTVTASYFPRAIWLEIEIFALSHLICSNLFDRDALKNVPQFAPSGYGCAISKDEWRGFRLRYGDVHEMEAASVALEAFPRTIRDELEALEILQLFVYLDCGRQRHVLACIHFDIHSVIKTTVYPLSLKTVFEHCVCPYFRVDFAFEPFDEPLSSDFLRTATAAVNRAFADYAHRFNALPLLPSSPLKCRVEHMAVLYYDAMKN